MRRPLPQTEEWCQAGPGWALRQTRSPSDSVLIYVILTAISLLTVALNLLVIISISHFKQLHTPTNHLLLSLAVSDFFVGLNMCFQSMLIDGCWYLGDLMCVLYYVFDIVVTSASVGTMVLISVDRYVAICDPLHYPTKVTPKRIRTMQPHVAAVTQRGKVSPKKSELKAARTLGVVIVAFLICLFPYYCVILSGQDTLLDILSVTFFLCLFYFNSCLNPIIYAFFYPWFRKSVKLIVTFQIVKSGSSDASML
ncbi:atrophin-1 interacting protein 3 (BAI1-associated protein 1) [Sarotherodon galilaeus]